MQSIAGGGGIVTTLATDLEKSGGSSSKGETDYDIDFNFGGKYGSAIKVPGESDPAQRLERTGECHDPEGRRYHDAGR